MLRLQKRKPRWGLGESGGIGKAVIWKEGVFNFAQRELEPMSGSSKELDTGTTIFLQWNRLNCKGATLLLTIAGQCFGIL